MQITRFFLNRYFLLASVLAVAAAALYAFVPREKVLEAYNSLLRREHAPAASNKPPPSVTVALPIRKTIDVNGEWVGQLDSPQTVELRAREMGYIKEINFQDGAEIEVGALLFVIDPEP